MVIIQTTLRALDSFSANLLLPARARARSRHPCETSQPHCAPGQASLDLGHAGLYHAWSSLLQHFVSRVIWRVRGGKVSTVANSCARGQVAGPARLGPRLRFRAGAAKVNPARRETAQLSQSQQHSQPLTPPTSLLGALSMSSPSLSRTRSNSQGSSDGDQFQEATDNPSPAPSPSLTTTNNLGSPPLPARVRSVEDDNQTLAALAASSSSSLPIRPGSNQSTDSLDQIDPNSASFLLLASLRSQITDLSSQVTSLNSKLVKSYTQIGDLEDDLHEVKAEDYRLKSQLSTLVQDKQRWEREIEGGGWVERVSLRGPTSSSACHACRHSADTPPAPLAESRPG